MNTKKVLNHETFTLDNKKYTCILKEGNEFNGQVCGGCQYTNNNNGMCMRIGSFGKTLDGDKFYCEDVISKISPVERRGYSLDVIEGVYDPLTDLKNLMKPQPLPVMTSEELAIILTIL